MRLLNRTSYTYLILAVPIIIITMILFYFLIRNFNLKHVENNLKVEHNKIIRKSQDIENYYIEDELSDELFVYEISKDSVIKDKYTTVSVFDKIENQYEPYRQLETMQEIAGKNYRILIRKSLVENSTLVYSISIAVFVLVLVMAGTFIALNRILADKIWSPFNEIILNLSNYRIGGIYKMINPTKIDEFNALNKSLATMAERINKEFFVQKEFIDIVSHEYQTPLTVVANEAEMLLQNENLSEEEFKKIYRIIEYVQRLSKMNQALLLLSRIDNSQYHKTSSIEIKPLVEQVLKERSSQIEMRNIHTKIIEREPCILTINPLLGSILIGNLIQNAIRHNLISDGELEIHLSKEKMVISNSGEEEELIPSLIFKKFEKSGKSKNSIGLGLNIVKAICDYSQLLIVYSYDSNRKMHSFSIYHKEISAS